MKLKLFILVFFSFIFNCKTNTPLRPTISVNPYDVITSPLTININSMGVWSAHEGELGIIQLIDSDGKEMAYGIMSATEEWMKSGPVQFKTTIVFDAKEVEKGTLIIHNNQGDRSGDEAGESHQFEVPIRFKP